MGQESLNVVRVEERVSLCGCGPVQESLNVLKGNDEVILRLMMVWMDGPMKT